MILGPLLQYGISNRQLEHRRKCVRHHDATIMIQAISRDLEGLASFCGGQHQAGQNLKKMPSDFLLGVLRNPPQQGAFVLAENSRIFTAGFFESISGAHTHDWIIVGHQLDKGID